MADWRGAHALAFPVCLWEPRKGQEGKWISFGFPSLTVGLLRTSFPMSSRSQSSHCWKRRQVSALTLAVANCCSLPLLRVWRTFFTTHFWKVDLEGRMDPTVYALLWCTVSAAGLWLFMAGINLKFRNIFNYVYTNNEWLQQRAPLLDLSVSVLSSELLSTEYSDMLLFNK